MAEKVIRKVSIYVDGDRVIDNIKGIKDEYKKLLNEQAKAPLNSEKYIESTQKIRKLDAILQEHRKNIKESGSTWDKLKQHVENFTGVGLGKMALFGASVGALWTVFRDGFRDMMALGKALSELKALTGSSAEDMKYYRQEALNMQLQMNITAEDAVKAFQYVGSAKPELLKSKEALASVTKEAVILSKASGMDLPDAAKNLTGAMNQFNLPADQARRTINSLAAGAKEGAAEIDEQTDSMKNFGAVANMANVPLEESIGIIQTLAEKSIKGAEAGTGIRNFLLTLESGAKETKPSIVGLDQALKNLNKKNLDATQLTKMFGKENVVVAQTLIANAEKVKKYTKAVTGTNEAYVQAEERSNNLSSALSDLGNSWSAWVQGLMGSDGWLTKIIYRLSQFVRWMNEISKSKKDLENEKDASDMAKYDKEDKKALDKYGKNEIVNMKATLELYKKHRAEYKKMYDEDWKRIQGNPFLRAMYNDKYISKTMPAVKGANEYNTYDKLVKQQETRISNAESYLDSKENAKPVGTTHSEKKEKKKKKKKGSKDEAEELRRQIVEQENKLRNEIEDIRSDLSAKLKGEEEQEVISCKKKYSELANEAAGNSDLLLEIEKLRIEEERQIRDKYRKVKQDKEKEDLDQLIDKIEKEVTARRDAERSISEALMTDKDREKEQIKKHYQELIELAKKYGIDTAAIYKKMQDEISALGRTYDIFGMTEKDWEKFNTRLNVVLQFSNELISAYQAYSQYKTANENKALHEEEQRSNKEKSSLKKKLDSKIISQKTYEKKVEQIDKRLDKQRAQLAIKQAKRQKEIQRIQTVINTAAAIVGFLSNPGGYAGIGLSIAAGVTGALQLAAINSAEIPGYIDGGRVKGKQLAWLSEDNREEGVLNNGTLTSRETGPIANWLLDRQDGREAAFPARSLPSPNASSAINAINSSKEVVVVVKHEDISIERSGQVETVNNTVVEELKRLNAYMQDPANRRAYLTNEILDQRDREIQIRKKMSTLKM